MDFTLPQGRLKEELLFLADEADFAPLDEKQMELSAEFLDPNLNEIAEALTSFRKKIDIRLSLASTPRKTKYPVGFCAEIRKAVFEAITKQGSTREKLSLPALDGFIEAGGIFKGVWGMQHDRYFQHAIQAGPYWFDVANDTVDPSRDPVEILPLEASGFKPVHSFEDFIRVGATYWGSEFYPNFSFPYLTPLYPILAELENNFFQVQAIPKSLSALNVLSGFQMASNFLSSPDFAGKELPSEIIQRFRNRISVAPRNPEEAADKFLQYRKVLLDPEAGDDLIGHLEHDWAELHQHLYPVYL